MVSPTHHLIVGGQGSGKSYQAKRQVLQWLFAASQREGGVVATALCTAWVLMCVGLPQAHAMSLRDDRGVSVSVPNPPQRIVSLLPSLTETVCALGACGRLVGTDRFSNHPAAVRALPKTGGLEDANVELIASLKPDLVLLSVSSRVTERLEALGLRVMALEPKTQTDVHRVALGLSQVLGQGDAGERLWQGIQAQMQEAALSVPPQARGLRVYFEVDSAPYAAGESSFIGLTLTRWGVRNIVPASLGAFPKLNPEFVVRADPQIIMVSERSGQMLGARPGWSRIEAVRRQRVCTFTSEQGDALTRPGPRMGEAAAIMAACLRTVVRPERQP